LTTDHISITGRPQERFRWQVRCRVRSCGQDCRQLLRGRWSASWHQLPEDKART